MDRELSVSSSDCGCRVASSAPVVVGGGRSSASHRQCCSVVSLTSGRAAGQAAIRPAASRRRRDRGVARAVGAGDFPRRRMGRVPRNQRGSGEERALRSLYSRARRASGDGARWSRAHAIFFTRQCVARVPCGGGAAENSTARRRSGADLPARAYSRGQLGGRRNHPFLRCRSSLSRLRRWGAA